MKNKEIYVHGIVKDSKNNMEKYLFTENERLNAYIDELEEKRKYDLCFISHLKKDKEQLQQRIEKAIKYCHEIFPLDLELAGLLEILGGDNNGM